MSTKLSFDGGSDWVSQSEAARIRGVTRQAIHKLVKGQRFRTLEVGGHIFLHRGDVESFTGNPPGRPASKEHNAK